ncbi:metallophosphoesterase [Pedococcus dokdonensis]|uniref:metallophosphoesterase n=1 Tax=Pedococcus dokdonensis TaxID=443156 RepID=UPI000B84A19D|nr:metallophosphoesterase [Pedococcus dokdonensis]
MLGALVAVGLSPMTVEGSAAGAPAGAVLAPAAVVPPPGDPAVLRPGALVPPAPARAASVDTVFSFAVMPDTQDEVVSSDPRMAKRISWLVQNRARLDLRWVLHSGDLQNWDTPGHEQFATTSTRLSALTTAGLPFLAAPGNHDTAAVCPGGSACPGAPTSVTLRDTTTWNAYYPPSRFGMQGVYEAGKSDNGWRTFSAGGLRWLVLDLELWPRAGVVSWARSVVATHPHHNVIVVTHAFLTSTGTVSTSTGGYGATSPKVLWAALDDYPNVVMVFSGHVGQVINSSIAARGVDGHKVATFLQAMHARYTNPVRIVTVDVVKRTLRTQIRSNYDASKPVGRQDVVTIHPYTSTITNMRWVR